MRDVPLFYFLTRAGGPHSPRGLKHSVAPRCSMATISDVPSLAFGNGTANERQPAARWNVIAAFCAVLLCLWLFFFVAAGRRVNVYDEGVLLTGAMRVMHGQLIHRDFYYNYGPARIYLLAGIFKAFGPSVLV